MRALLHGFRHGDIENHCYLENGSTMDTLEDDLSPGTSSQIIMVEESRDPSEQCKHCT